MSGTIAQYWASLGFRVDKNETTKVDTYLKNLTEKLEKFNEGLSKSLTLNQKVLEKNLGDALDIASKKVVFEVSKFAVNDRALQAAMLRATRRLRGGTGSVGGFGTTIINNRALSSQEWDRRQAIQHANRMGYLRNRQGSAGGTGGGSHRGNARTGTGYYSVMHAGGAAGAIARFGIAGVPFLGGAYGLSTLNQANQNLVSTEVAAASIFGDKASQATNFLKQHADYVGYNYLDTMPIFSSFMASAMPLMGFDKSQQVFESLAEFGRTRGADAVGMKRAMTAIQQMAA